jgi:hypothetical protein
MVRWLLFAMVLSGCRYLGPVAPQVTPERPSLLSGGSPADPTRQPPLPARRCVVDCGPGHHCNEKTAECEADPDHQPRDGGVLWLP